MKLTLATVLAIVAIANAGSIQPSRVCEVSGGRKLTTFSEDTVEMLNMPCKYNAIRDTVCGDWRVVVSPGNTLEPKKHKYIVDTVWFSMTNTTSGLKWEARASRRSARNFLKHKNTAPFVKQDGYLESSDVVTFEKGENSVSFREKNNQFMFTFGLFDEENKKWDKTSGFRFECNSERFEPSDYPLQICELQGFRQKPGNCEAAMKALSNKCKEEERFEAVKKCWPILGKPKYYKTMSHWAEDPASGFRHCLEFVCSGYTDKNACYGLDADLQGYPCLRDIKEKVKEHCNPHHECTEKPKDT